MFARRLLIVGLVVVVVVSAVRSGSPTQPDLSTEPDRVGLDVGRDDGVTIPTASSSEPAITAQTTSPGDAWLSVATTPVEAETTTSLPSAELSDLVAGSRPPLPAGEMVDDGALYAHHHPHATSVEATASSVVVSLWTWRFDDADGRTQDQLVGLVYDDVIERITPSPEQVAARGAAGEVSWAIVRQVTVDGPVATVTFDHHLVTSISAELVTSRTATVTFFDGRVIEMSL